MAKERLRKKDFSLDAIFSVTRVTTRSWRKEIDAPSEADALNTAEVAGADFEKGATLVKTAAQLQVEPNTPAPENRPLPDGLLSIPEAAVRMNVTERWLYRNWKRLKLGTKVSHRQVRISTRAIERYLKMRQPV